MLLYCGEYINIMLCFRPSIFQALTPCQGVIAYTGSHTLNDGKRNDQSTLTQNVLLERSWHNTNQNHHYFQKSNWQFNESYYQFWSLSQYSSVCFFTRSGFLELIACSSTKTKMITKTKAFVCSMYVLKQTCDKRKLLFHLSP